MTSGRLHCHYRYDFPQQKNIWIKKWKEIFIDSVKYQNSNKNWIFFWIPKSDLLIFSNRHEHFIQHSFELKWKKLSMSLHQWWKRILRFFFFFFSKSRADKFTKENAHSFHFHLLYLYHDISVVERRKQKKINLKKKKRLHFDLIASTVLHTLRCAQPYFFTLLFHFYLSSFFFFFHFFIQFFSLLFTLILTRLWTYTFFSTSLLTSRLILYPYYLFIIIILIIYHYYFIFFLSTWDILGPSRCSFTHRYTHTQTFIYFFFILIEIIAIHWPLWSFVEIARLNFFFFHEK